MQISPGKCTIWGSFEPASHEGSGEERAAFRERVPYFVHLNSDLGEMRGPSLSGENQRRTRVRFPSLMMFHAVGSLIPRDGDVRISPALKSSL